MLFLQDEYIRLIGEMQAFLFTEQEKSPDLQKMDKLTMNCLSQNNYTMSFHSLVCHMSVI